MQTNIKKEDIIHDFDNLQEYLVLRCPKCENLYNGAEDAVCLNCKYKFYREGFNPRGMSDEESEYVIKKANKNKELIVESKESVSDDPIKEDIPKEKEGEFIKKEKKIKTNRLFKLFVIAGILMFFAVVIDYFFIVPSEPEVKELSQITTVPLEKHLCNRKEPYEMPEEFKRALSLRKQRLAESGKDLYEALVKSEESYENCLNIQYSDLRMIGGAEGVFWFDDSLSNMNDLRINIDNIYKFNDDVLSAVVLQHELTHVKEFVDKKNGFSQRISLTCLESEQMAFEAQTDFVLMLNEGEWESLVTRINKFRRGNLTNEYSNNFFSTLTSLFDEVLSKSLKDCNSLISSGKIPKNEKKECLNVNKKRNIKKMLETSNYCKD